MEVASSSGSILSPSSSQFALPRSLSLPLHCPHPSASHVVLAPSLSLIPRPLTLHPFTPVPIFTIRLIMKHNNVARYPAHHMTIEKFTGHLQSISANLIHPTRPLVDREDANDRLTRVITTHLMLPITCNSFDPAMRFVHQALTER
jgi:hypothetical protein